MLTQVVAAAAGLTILAPAAAFAAVWSSGAAEARAPSPIKTILAEAKREGRLNTIALPPDWANYGEIMSTFRGGSA